MQIHTAQPVRYRQTIVLYIFETTTFDTYKRFLNRLINAHPSTRGTAIQDNLQGKIKVNNFDQKNPKDFHFNWKNLTTQQ